MICQLCKKKTTKNVKTVNDIDVFECENCRLGFVDQKQTRHLNPQEEYSLQGYKQSEKKLRARFEWIASEIQKYKLKGKVLDVGAGYGLLSSILYNKGYEIEIIEPKNTPYYLHDKKFKHYKTTIEKFSNNQKGRYDIICMMDVIEHLINPLLMLRKLKQLLNKKGIIVIQTPNYKSLMAQICKNWSWWMVSDHKYFLSPKSTRILLEKAGFSISELDTYESLEDFKKNLDGNFVSIKNPAIRKLVKGIFYSVFFPVYILFRNILWKLHCGGLIFTISRTL